MNCSDCKNTGKQICTVCCTYQGGVPDRWEPKPVTNYDRIISKTPEELAEWLVLVEQRILEMQPALERPALYKDWLDWLKQEDET